MKVFARSQPISTVQLSPKTRPRTAPSIAAVIPAYNEVSKIGAILDVLLQLDVLNEIIVVDDGSTDQTGEECWRKAQSDSRIRVVSHPFNLGKGQSVFSGWRATQATYLLLLDADLMGLTKGHLEQLIQPVLAGEADMTIGRFCGGWWFTDLSHLATPWLSGQRCLRSDLLRFVPQKAAAGYGLETALTVVAHHNAWRCQRVPIRGVWHLPKEDHFGFFRGFSTRLKMYGQIISAWYQIGGPGHMAARFRVRFRQN